MANHGHRLPVSAAAVSPDQRVFASAGYDRDIVLWHARSAEVLGTLRGHTSLVNGLDWAPDGSAVASAASDHTARIWQPLAGDSLAVLRGHADDVNAVRFAPDGQRLATASFDGTVRIWRRSGEPLLVAAHHGADVNGVAWFPDGRRLAAGSDDRTVSIFDAESGRVRRVLHGHDDWVDQVAVHPSGLLLASASLDRSVALWNTATGTCVARLRDADCAVKDVVFTPDGTRLATTAYDGCVRVYDSESFRLLATYRAEGLWNRRLAWTGHGWLTGGFGGGPVEVGEFGTRRFGAQTTGGANGFALSPGGELAAVCCDDGRVYAVSVRERAVRGVLAEHDAAVLCASFSPDGRWLVTGSWDRSARLWSVDAAEVLRADRPGHGAPAVRCAAVCTELRDPVNTVQFDPSGDGIWLGTFNGEILFWDTAGKNLEHRGAHGGSVKFMEPSGDGVVSVGRDGWVLRWQRAGGERPGFETGSTILNGVASAGERGWLATASRRNGLELWTAGGQRVAQFAEHACSLKSVAWSADEALLAGVYYDGYLTLVAPDTGLSRVRSLAASSLSQVRFAGSTLLASAWDAEGSLHFVDVRSGSTQALGVSG